MGRAGPWESMACGLVNGTSCGKGHVGPTGLAWLGMACQRHDTTQHGKFDILSVNIKNNVFYYFLFFLLSKNVVKALKVILLKDLKIEKIQNGSLLNRVGRI